jgi:hypothetical protein
MKAEHQANKGWRAWQILLVVLVSLGLVIVGLRRHERALRRKRQQLVCTDLSREYELTPDGPQRLALKDTLKAAGCIKP